MSKRFPPEASTSRSAHFAQHLHLFLTSKHPAVRRSIVQQIDACVVMCNCSTCLNASLKKARA